LWKIFFVPKSLCSGVNKKFPVFNFNLPRSLFSEYCKKKKRKKEEKLNIVPNVR